MKLHQLLTTLCTAALLSGSSLAQNAGNLIDAAKLDGKQVKNLQGEDVGEIKQVLIDPQSGRARYAVIQVNKLWQLNDPEVAVPFTALKISGKPSDANFQATLDATKEKLTSAPKFKAGDADRLYSKQQAAPIYSYWAIMWFDDASSGESGSSTAGNQGGSGSTAGSAKAGSGTSGSGGSEKTQTQPSTSTSGASSGADASGTTPGATTNTPSTSTKTP